jgi:diaminohydroxyphosphoribosylaminopyrimidine deaminase/5-amino-6-(5-phosphoribosylamino)uracil reductase
MIVEKEKGNSAFMLRAIRLAASAYNCASPNPRVGCVIVKNGKVISEDLHKVYGGVHAEAGALRKAGKKARGSDLYVNLEPCSHHGKNPPCTDAIIRAGVKRVFAAIKDPNPKVNGKGIRQLRKAGIRVSAGLAEAEATALNAPYLKSAACMRPFVILKLAVSSDGMITYGDGRRKAVTSRQSRDFFCRFRNYTDAVLVGINTVMKDNPRLTARPLLGKNPLRIVLDSSLRIKDSSAVLGEGAVVFYSRKKGSKAAIKRLSKRAKLIPVSERQGHLSLQAILDNLNRLGVTTLLVEGGAEVFSSFANSGLYDLAVLVVSGRKAGRGKSAFSGVKRKFTPLSAGILGKDLVIEVV